MMLASLFATVARTFAQGGSARMFRQEELCPLLGLPSDLIVTTLLPHLHDTRDLVSRKLTAAVHEGTSLAHVCRLERVLMAMP